MERPGRGRGGRRGRRRGPRGRRAGRRWPRRSPGRPGCPGRLAKSVRFATGELRVYKNRQYACALTVAKTPGTRRSMAVTLQSRGGRAVTDAGRFTHRAGPVTVHALNRCVRATGSVSGRGGVTGWILC
ncbi:hypothetical protein LUX12_14765 [Streptomyces somaliensis]|uniref:hypothetical protein n=1 Tax=Streptomyces somaliensis TaxID=78355 RepID=UPI0020CD3C69|nr:hypothetical protein [Streptomyces somaliensis]MCP9945771.1 hypothetical protein [Streptomyces somaliensis]